MEKNKEWLKEEINKVTSRIYGADFNTIKETDDLINQLEEPNEIELSEPSAWKTIAKLYHPNEVYWGNVRDSYIESLDEPEKVVIPQFVADFIEEVKPNFNIRTVFTLKNNKHEQGQEWALDNPDVFARAWIDGYSVEKEPQWVVKDDTGYLSYLRFSIPNIYERETSLDKNDAYKFNSKSKADLIADLVTGTVEEITK